MANEVQLVELVLGESVALVEVGSSADEHFRGLGYEPRGAEPAPDDEGAEPAHSDEGAEPAPAKRGRPRKKAE